MGALVTAIVVVGVALDATDVVGATVGVGAAHADPQSDTASATTTFFTTSG